MPRPRFTVRWMMALVAIVAIGIGLWGTLVRARHIRNEAAKHALAERELETVAIEFTKLAEEDAQWYARWKSSGEDPGMLIDYLNEMDYSEEGYAENRALIESFRDSYRKGAAEERQLRIKYERAARRPWLSVEPDPVEPDHLISGRF